MLGLAMRWLVRIVRRLRGRLALLLLLHVLQPWQCGKEHLLGVGPRGQLAGLDGGHLLLHARGVRVLALGVGRLSGSVVVLLWGHRAQRPADRLFVISSRRLEHPALHPFFVLELHMQPIRCRVGHLLEDVQ